MQINFQNNSINFQGYRYIPNDTTLHKIQRFTLNPFKLYANKLFGKSIYVSKWNMLSKEEKLANIIEDVTLKPTPKTTTYAWDINPKHGQKYLIFMHGAGQNVSNNQPLYKKIISSTDFGILAPEYRGFGQNQISTVSKKTLSQDTSAAFDYLVKKGIHPNNIYVAGHSFGAYPATLLAKNNNVNKLILISPVETRITTLLHHAKYMNVSPKFQQIFHKSKFIQKYLDKMFFNTEGVMKKCKTSVDIIHSEKDNLINNNEFNTIAKACKNLHSMVVLPGGSHKLDSSKMDELVKILNEGV